MKKTIVFSLLLLLYASYNKVVYSQPPIQIVDSIHYCLTLESNFTTFRFPKFENSSSFRLFEWSIIPYNPYGDKILFTHDVLRDSLIAEPSFIDLPIFKLDGLYFYIRAFDSLENFSRDSLWVSFSEFQYDLSEASSIQKGDTVRLPLRVAGGTGKIEYLWSPTISIIGDSTECCPLVSPDTTTLYKCNIIDEKGCSTEGAFKVIVDTLSPIKHYNIPNIEVYPNPTESYLNFGGLKENVTIEVYSILGQLELKRNTTNKQIDITSLKEGLHYFVLRDNGKPVYKGKFVKM